MPRERQQATCHPDKLNVANGLCQNCYMRHRRNAPLKEGDVRADCHPEKRAFANGLCEACYNKQWRTNDPERERKLAARRVRENARYAAWRALNPTQSRPHGRRKQQEKLAAMCHPEKREYARGLCRACYMRERRATAGGVPPTCGHPERRNYAHSKCHACYQSWRRTSTPEILKASLESGRRHSLALRSDPEKHEAHKALQRAARRESEFGLTSEQYDAALMTQERKCAICSSAFTEVAEGNPPCIDHCHELNIFRGLLCRSCNLMLGYAKDNIAILQAAIRYLEVFAAKQVAAQLS
jgi:hypothetical protein